MSCSFGVTAHGLPVWSGTAHDRRTAASRPFWGRQNLWIVAFRGSLGLLAAPQSICRFMLMTSGLIGRPSASACAGR